jgi:NADH-quinone oxidoreductase subunit J
MIILDYYFYINSSLIIFSTLLALTATNAIHGLLYFVVSVIALAVDFYLLDAWLAAALEVMVYAGAIMVLFVFVVMLLNIKYNKTRNYKTYLGPALLAFILILEIFLVTNNTLSYVDNNIISVKQVALCLFNKYSIALEIASLLLLAGIIGAYHIGKKRSSS